MGAASGPLTGYIVSAAEAARLRSCSRNHVYRLLETNELPTVQLAIGRSLTRISTSDIEAVIDFAPSLPKSIHSLDGLGAQRRGKARCRNAGFAEPKVFAPGEWHCPLR